MSIEELDRLIDELEQEIRSKLPESRECKEYVLNQLHRFLVDQHARLPRVHGQVWSLSSPVVP